MNQVSTLINKVQFDKETFNYEHYKARAMTTGKDVSAMIFMTSGKLLVQEHYK